jgi:hypothetical protein
MAKKQINKISDKLAKVNDSFSVQMYDNGFMFEIGGKDTNGDWKNAKIMCSTIDQLVALVKEVTELDKDE